MDDYAKVGEVKIGKQVVKIYRKGGRGGDYALGRTNVRGLEDTLYHVGSYEAMRDELGFIATVEAI